MITPPASPIYDITGLDPTMYNADEALALYNIQLQMYEHETTMLPSPPVRTSVMSAVPPLEYWGAPFDPMSAETTPIMCSDMVMLDYWPMENQALFVDIEGSLALASSQQLDLHGHRHTPYQGEEIIATVSATIPTITASTLPAVASPQPSTKAPAQTTRSPQNRHSCTLCGRTFTRFTDLRRHKRTSLRHSQKQYACTHCDRIFTRPHDVRRHAANAHGIERIIS